MSKDMHIKGISYPSENRDKNLNAEKIPPVRPGQFIWLGVIVVLGILVTMFGTPHLRFQYQYTGARSNPHYLSCQYIGIHSQTINPQTGKCPLIRLFKLTSIGE